MAVLFGILFKTSGLPIHQAVPAELFVLEIRLSARYDRFLARIHRLIG